MGSTLNIQKQIKNQSKRVSLVCLPCAKICLFADALKELDDAYERYCRETDSAQRRKLQLSIQRALIRSQELGDEKIQIAGQMVIALALKTYFVLFYVENVNERKCFFFKIKKSFPLF